MKKSTLIKSICALITVQLFVFISYAQPTYTYTDGMLTIGDSVEYHITNWTSAGPSGPGQVWNFSTLQDLGLTIDSIVNPSTTPFGSNYPTAQVAGGNILGYGYYTQSATDLQLLGSADANTFVVFSDPWQFRSYPMEYDSNWTDSFSGSGISAGNNFTSSGSCLDTVDGWGTLILPNGTFTNVLRLHSTAAYTEIYAIDTHQHFWETYEWFISGSNRALLVFHQNIDTINGSQVNQITYAVYLDTLYTTTSIYNISSSSPSITLMPNPANNRIYAELNVSDSESMDIFIYDALGRKVTYNTVSIFMVNGNRKIEIGLENLPTGFYNFVLQHKEGITSAKFIKE